MGLPYSGLSPLLGMPSSLSIVFAELVHLWLPSGRHLKNQLQIHILLSRCIKYYTTSKG